MSSGFRIRSKSRSMPAFASCASRYRLAAAHLAARSSPAPGVAGSARSRRLHLLGLPHRSGGCRRNALHQLGMLRLQPLTCSQLSLCVRGDEGQVIGRRLAAPFSDRTLGTGHGLETASIPESALVDSVSRWPQRLGPGIVGGLLRSDVDPDWRPAVAGLPVAGVGATAGGSARAARPWWRQAASGKRDDNQCDAGKQPDQGAARRRRTIRARTVNLGHGAVLPEVTAA